MFAAIYFGEVVFAGLPSVGVIPPPPPPPTPVEAVECNRFAIGQCIGLENSAERVPRRGQASCVGRIGVAIGFAGGAANDPPRPC